MKINRRREVFFINIRKKKYFKFFKQNRKELMERNYSQNLNNECVNYLKQIKSNGQI